MLIVQKFGGSSLADIDRLRHSANICMEARSREHDVVAVVSAMGDATDDLIELAQRISSRPSPREMDALMTTGEQQSAALMAIMLESLGAKAVSLTGWQAGVLTDCRNGDGEIRLIAPSRVREAISQDRIAVVAGFQGFCSCGDITSLGRGGSDTTAVALAAALDADRCEIYTDVDGIYTADPRLISAARHLECIDYRDMLALSRSGSQVLHHKCVELAMLNGVEIYLKSSFDSAPGSVVRFVKDSARGSYAGVTRCADSGEVSIAGLAADASALSAMVLLLAGAGISVLSGSVGENSATVKVAPEHVLPAMELIHREMLLRS